VLRFADKHLRLLMEFAITVLILAGAFTILVLPTSGFLNEHAYAIITLALGYWFGRGTQVLERER
jgi:hypothetical protein